MYRVSFAKMNCSIAQSLEIIGEWWTILILRDAFFGVGRFEQFQHRLGIPRNILTARLRKLVSHGILERRQYQRRPVRFEYRLTPRGRDLYGTLLTLMQWGDRWVLRRGRHPVVLRHHTCGEPTHPVLVCERCRQPLRLRDLRLEAGPGATDPNTLPPTAARATPASQTF